MEILCNLLLFLSLCVEVFNLKVVKRPDFRTSKALILNDCNKDYESIIIIDDANKLDLMWVQQLHEKFHSVILHKGNIQDPEDYSELKKVDAILITVSSVSRIKPILKHYSKRSWWNVMIPVYVLNLPHNDCKKTMDILHQTWAKKILTVYFLCIKKNIIDIYTYNPFTNRAPKSWKAIERSTTESRWIIYHRKYQKASICHELNFDRTKYLDGYPITALVSASTPRGFSLVGQYVNNSDRQPNEPIIENRYHFAIDALEKTLNVSLRLYVIDEDKIRASKLSFRQITEIICKEVSASIMVYDYIMQSRTTVNKSTMLRTYPLAWKTVGIATYHYGYQTLAEKMWDFYGTWTILFTILVLFITFAVIRFIERRKTAFTVFEILRLLINHSLHTPMNNLYLRIFFLTILIYFLIIHATFSGHLAKFLTKPELRRHPETLEDLRDLGYTKIYNSKYIHEYLKKKGEKPLKLDLRANYCVHHLLYKDSSVACLFDHLLLLTNAQQNEKLYVSKKPLKDQYVSYPIVKNWPLMNRVNIILTSLEDLGFRKLYSTKLMEDLNKSFKIVESKSSEDFHPIELEHLIFGFLILAMGLTSAIISFCVEILINIKPKHIVKFNLEKLRKNALLRVKRINTRHKTHG